MTSSHLIEPARRKLELPDAERIAAIKSERWIGYTRAKQILDKLEDLMVHPKTTRMPNILLVGDTNNGKSTIVRRFEQMHPRNDDPNSDSAHVPVLVVQAPPVPDEGRFYNAILESIYAPFRPAGRLDQRQYQTLKLLRMVETRVLVIDEIHHVLAGSTNRQRTFLNTVKYLGNELQISIVGVGTHDAFNAINTDPQLSNRFEPAVLKPWALDNEYLKLLTSFERMLPLKLPSELSTPKMAARLHGMTEATIGELATLLKRAAARAIKDKTERIDFDILDSVMWVTPSQRRRQTG